jgi:hypothetical protein
MRSLPLEAARCRGPSQPWPWEAVVGFGGIVGDRGADDDDRAVVRGKKGVDWGVAGSAGSSTGDMGNWWLGLVVVPVACSQGHKEEIPSVI